LLHIYLQFVKLIELLIAHQFQDRVVVQLVRFKDQFLKRSIQVSADVGTGKLEGVSVDLDMTDGRQKFEHVLDQVIVNLVRLEDQLVCVGTAVGNGEMQVDTLRSDGKFADVGMPLQKQTEERLILRMHFVSNMNVQGVGLNEGEILAHPT
jgi:hypothetical protein